MIYSESILDDLLESEIDIGRVDSPALKRIIEELKDGFTNEMTYEEKHSDWSEQAQCACVVGCTLG